MKTSAILVPRFPLATESRLASRLPYFITLMKPRVMALAVFTAFVGMMVAPGRVDPLLGFVAILAIATGAGAAGVLNMWYDADIDRLMKRTAMRPIPRGKISRTEALAFGLALAGSSVAALAFVVDIEAASLLAFAVFFYVAVYTMWLKRQTPQNIVIGGAAGALPPVIGWAAATGVRRPRAAHPVPDYFPLDTASLLGARAHSRRRICPCRRPHAAGRCWKERNCKADLRLQSASAAGFNSTLGAWLCRRSLRRSCCRLRCDPCCARGAGSQKPWDQPARSATIIRFLHFVPVCVVCRVVGQQHHSIDNGALRARCRDG